MHNYFLFLFSSFLWTAQVVQQSTNCNKLKSVNPYMENPARCSELNVNTDLWRTHIVPCCMACTYAVSFISSVCCDKAQQPFRLMLVSSSSLLPSHSWWSHNFSMLEMSHVARFLNLQLILSLPLTPLLLYHHASPGWHTTSC